jgi:cytochrome c oxidase cbb3-type subunit 4
MDVNIVREAALVAGLAAFAGIVWWAYGPARKARFERAAKVLFDDDERDAQSVAQALARARRIGEGD